MPTPLTPGTRLWNPPLPFLGRSACNALCIGSHHRPCPLHITLYFTRVLSLCSSSSFLDRPSFDEMDARTRPYFQGRDSVVLFLAQFHLRKRQFRNNGYLFVRGV